VPGSATAPVANFSVTSSSLCQSSNIQLTDASLNTPTSWTWTANSAVGVTFSNPNIKNPTVQFANSALTQLL